MSSDLLLALGSLAGAVTAAFATVFAAVRNARKDRQATALSEYQRVVDERRQLAEDMRTELTRQLDDMRQELARVRGERDAAVTARDLLLMRMGKDTDGEPPPVGRT